MPKFNITPVAGAVPFDNTGTDLVANNTQDAIVEIENRVNTSASPGFSYGRTGNITPGTYLQCESVPSNISGRWVYINSASVTKVFVSNELTTTFSVSVYSHDGNEANLTLLGTVTVSAAKGDSFDVNWSVATDKQLAVRLSPTSANSAKNIVCGLELAGTN